MRYSVKVTSKYTIAFGWRTRHDQNQQDWLSCPVSKVTQLTALRGEYRTEFSVFSVFEIPMSVSVSVFENIGYRFGISVYRLTTSPHAFLAILRPLLCTEFPAGIPGNFWNSGFCIHRPGREGVLRGGRLRQCPGDVCSDRGVCWDNGDRSLPVNLDMWDGWKAVGDIGVDFKT